MEIILFIVIFYFVYNAITKSNSSSPSSSNSSSTPNREPTIIPDIYLSSYQKLLEEYYQTYKDQVFQQRTLSEIQKNLAFERSLSEIKHDLKIVRRELGYSPSKSQTEPSKKHRDFYSYVTSMSDTQLINTINSQYKAIKGKCNVAPCMGKYGSADFAAVLLLWRYTINNFDKNRDAYASLQIILGDIIGCSFFGMPVEDWSDKVDPILNVYTDILDYDEFSSVFLYLYHNFGDEIHQMEFNNGNTKPEVYRQLYMNFAQIYNSTNNFSDMLDYYTKKGLKIKESFRMTDKQQINNRSDKNITSSLQTTNTKPPKEDNHDNLEKGGVDKDFGKRNQKHGDFYFYVVNMSDTQLINTINGQYKAIKGSWSLAPCMGEYGSIEFSVTLLLWEYALRNFRSNQEEYGSLLITLGDMIGCSFFGMPAGEWSDHIDPILNAHTDILTRDEFGSVYNYLRNNYADEIHSMEFNKGNANEEVYRQNYVQFMQVYNTTNNFSGTLDFYEKVGLKIKDNFRFNIGS